MQPSDPGTQPAPTLQRRPHSPRPTNRASLVKLLHGQRLLHRRMSSSQLNPSVLTQTPSELG